MYLASQRKEFILKTLAEHGAARTIALAKQMKVTDETVRNDLINLEKRGFLKRVHGGALALTHKSLHEDIVTQDHVSIQIAKKPFRTSRPPSSCSLTVAPWVTRSATMSTPETRILSPTTPPF